MTDPIEIEFTVDCSPEHAFATWTKASRWWPSDHTVSAEAGVAVLFEGRVGGRIFERTSAGIEHDWGEITQWEPPHRLEYLWHIGSDRPDATEVEVTFGARDGATVVRIEHRGWDRFGATAATRRTNNDRGWSGMLPHFVEACRPA